MNFQKKIKWERYTSTKLVLPRVRAAITRFTSDSNLALSTSSGGVTYHLDKRVLPCLFCSKKKRIYGFGISEYIYFFRPNSNKITWDILTMGIVETQKTWNIFLPIS